MDTEKFIDEKIKSGFLNERYNEDGTTSVIGEHSYLCEIIDDLFKQRLEASPLETLVMPQQLPTKDEIFRKKQENMNTEKRLEEQIVSFETAKLAKEKGLVKGLVCRGVYCIGYKSMKPNKELLTESAPRNSVRSQFHLALAPTQSLLQTWLREEHGIHVEVLHGRDTKNENKVYYEVAVYKDSDCKSEFYIPDLCKHEEALEKGLQGALTLIK